MTHRRIPWLHVYLVLTFAVLLLFENGVSKGVGAWITGEIEAGGAQ